MQPCKTGDQPYSDAFPSSECFLEQLIPTPEVCSLNLVIGKIHLYICLLSIEFKKTKINKKRPGLEIFCHIFRRRIDPFIFCRTHLSNAKSEVLFFIFSPDAGVKSGKKFFVLF